MFDSDDQEVLDVVNDHDEVIGTISRGDMMKLKETSNRFLRIVEIFIQRPNGDIYLPRRSMEKKIAPGGLDLSVAGHILSGESYEQACIREIKEEADIDANLNDITFIAKLDPTPNLFYFRVIYLLHTDMSPRLSPEHTEAKWIAPDKLEETVQKDVPTKETLYEDISVLVNFLNNNQR
jgi:isopentenyldiphosphate isomerase